jgi:hypothetical protein
VKKTENRGDKKLRICGENVNEDYVILFFHGGCLKTGSTNDYLIYVEKYQIYPAFPF